MTRPLIRWLLFAICLAVFLGALLWTSLRTLDLERQTQSSAEDAQVQERVRLALWRMDSLASVMLIRENSRPPSHYQAFYAPEDLFSNTKDNKAIPKGQALQPSPLLGTQPDLVQFHFELLPGDPLPRSPQVPTGEQGQLADQWYAIRPEIQAISQKLQVLGELLQRHPEIKNQPRLSEAPAPAPPKVSQQAVSPALNDSDLSKDNFATQSVANQSMANSREMTQRSNIVRQSVAAEKIATFNAPMKKEKSFNAAAPSAAMPPAGTNRSRTDSNNSRLYGGDTAAAAATPSPSASTPLGTRQPLPAIAGDLRPIWIENELLLLRRASLDGRERLQGVLLDWPRLRAQLLEAVHDLLPDASLLPVAPDLAQTDATALVTLPLKLVAGRVPLDPIVLASPLKPTLAIAWACVIAAAIAIAFVLHRAVLLSERRGAFVSSVTHELRTPLTTFRLYSEMLAEDMIPDAARRREYLQTLCNESTRLMHLVENVLAYSRIERGRTAARLETLTVEDLLQRILPRLRQRADQVDLSLHTHILDEVKSAKVTVDAMAVEQILFNLADNACKYAAPDSSPRDLILQVEATPKGVSFAVRDFGPGLSKEARRKLFRPFGKSATEAAHSAPGVGLGLALCRRLARELHGELTHQATEGRGSSFCLTLRRA